MCRPYIYSFNTSSRYKTTNTSYNIFGNVYMVLVKLKKGDEDRNSGKGKYYKNG